MFSQKVNASTALGIEHQAGGVVSTTAPAASLVDPVGSLDPQATNALSIVKIAILFMIYLSWSRQR
jgi:hypothetical protein